MMNNPVHENSNYKVVVNEAGDGYEVINLVTDVMEFKAISMPECMFAAENLNVVIIHRTYEWIGQHEQKKADERAKESASAKLKLI